jgi:alpha-1,3-rhamnosyl/mannosyltransferase
MKILFNRRSTAGAKSGIGYYSSSLVKAMRKASGDHWIDLYPRRLVWAGCNGFARLLPLARRWRGRPSGRLRFLVPLAKSVASLAVKTMEKQFRSMLRRGNYDVYHEPNLLPMPSDVPTVVTLHDLSVLLHPEWHPVTRVRLYDRHFIRGIREARHFITVSETVRKQVIQVLNISPSRVTTIHNGVHPHLRPLSCEETTRSLRRIGLRPGYLLHLGTIEPRKNLLMLMQAYCSLPRILREQCPLLLVGAWGWGYRAAATYYENHARHQGVRILGYVAERWLPALYNGARALVCPSFAEGFGLPCAEMLACGGGVLASRNDVFREIVGGQAMLLPADQGDVWSKTMAEVILDDDLHRLLRVGAVKFARKYSWEESAARTLEVYRLAAGLSSAIPLSKAA